MTQDINNINNEERHLRIKIELLKLRKTFSGIAEKLDVTRGCVTNVSRGEYYIERVARTLAEEASLSFDELWPEKAIETSKKEAA